jgi:hypothetical protein
LHSWFNLLEGVFNCLALLLSPAALFIRSAYSQKFVQSARQDGFSSPGFPCLQVDAAPTVMIGALEEIEIGVRNYVMVIVFNRPARLPPSCDAAFRSARSHSFCAGSYLLSVSSRAWREGRSRLAANFFSVAPRHVGIGYTESVIIHGLFALFARHVPAANDASLCAPRI